MTNMVPLQTKEWQREAEVTDLGQRIDSVFNAASADDMDSRLAVITSHDAALPLLLERAIGERRKDPVSFAARRAFLHVACHALSQSPLEHKAISEYRRSSNNTIATDNWRERGAIYPYPLLHAFEMRDDAITLPTGHRVRQVVLAQFEKALNHLATLGGRHRELVIMRCADATRSLEGKGGSDLEHCCVSLFRRHMQEYKKEHGPLAAIELLHNENINEPDLSPGMIHTLQDIYLEIVMNDLSPTQAAETVRQTLRQHHDRPLVPVAKSIQGSPELRRAALQVIAPK